MPSLSYGHRPGWRWGHVAFGPLIVRWWPSPRWGIVPFDWRERPWRERSLSLWRLTLGMRSVGARPRA